MPKTVTETAETAATETAPTEQAPAEKTEKQRSEAAIAALKALDAKHNPPPTTDADVADEAEAESDGAETEAGAETEGEKPEEGKEEAPEEKPEKATTLRAKLVQKDRELQQAKAWAKGAVSIDEFRRDPIAAFKRLGIGPQSLLDLYLQYPEARPQQAAAAQPGQPAQQAQAQQPPQTSAEVAELKEQLGVLTRALQQRDLIDQTRARNELYNREISNIHHNVEAQRDRWETVAALKDEPGLASNKGGSYALVEEVAQEMYRQRIAALPPGATEEDVRAVAPSYADALDAVEEVLVERERKRQEKLANNKKLKPAEAAPARPAAKPAKPAVRPVPKPKRPGMPAQPAAPTPGRKRELTQEERERNAIAALEKLDRLRGASGGDDEEGDE